MTGAASISYKEFLTVPGSFRPLERLELVALVAGSLEIIFP
jgi:hypothetical protein